MGEEKFRSKEYYREKIIEMLNNISRTDILEYLHTFIKLFLEKWG